VFQNSLSTTPVLICAALIVVYIILGILYESFIHPLTILSTLPSAGVGALLALAAGGMDLSVIGIIGIILLIGIVKKNGIMLVDFAITAERDGMTPLEAIRTACLLRFRPILMTTAAAMLAGVPLTLGTGPGSELRQPLGYAMVGGLALSQLLRRQEIAMKPLWFPTAWSAEFTAGGQTLPLKSAFPITESPWTKGRISAPVVWVGLGTAADFRGRDVAGKAVMIYSIATPGGRDHSADWSGAIKRADDAGAAIIMVEMGFPGDSQSEPEGAVGTRAPTITITPDDANLIRDRLDANVDVELHLKLDTEKREGLKTANVWGVLPGASDEQILIMAHTDAFFEGAMDNASGIAMMLDIARHYGAVPQAGRPRTLVFLTTSDHHHGSVGIRSVRDNYDWSKVALIVNCEHPSQTLLYNLDAGLMTANEVSARRWYVGGSDALRSLVRGSFREFGVATYHKSEVSPGGELSQIHMKAPSFHIIDHVIYHTTLDTAELVPAWGLEDATRAFLKIIDGANKMTKQAIAAESTGLPDSTRPIR
jgi:hypothetical protein